MEGTEIPGPVDARIDLIVVDSADAVVYAMADSHAGPDTMFVSRDGANNWTRLADYDVDHGVRELIPHPLQGQ